VYLVADWQCKYSNNQYLSFVRCFGSKPSTLTDGPAMRGWLVSPGYSLGCDLSLIASNSSTPYAKRGTR
jgi:hypothetical protein